MRKNKSVQSALICFLTAVIAIMTGCGGGETASSDSVSGKASSAASSSAAEGSSDTNSADGSVSSEDAGSEDVTSDFVSQDAQSSKIASSSTASRSSSSQATGSYDYGRSPASTDWNNRFNMSTGFAMGGSGNRAMYEKIISQTKDAYFTTIEISSIDVTDPDPDGPGKAGVRTVIKTALDACRKYGIGAYVGDPYLGGWGDGGREIQERHVKETLDAYAGYGDVIQAFVLWDEPFKEQFPKVRQRYDWVRKLDPNIRLFINLFPSYGQYGWGNTSWGSESYTSYVDQFLQVVKPDMLSVDYYAFGTSGSNSPDLLSNTEMLWADMGYFRKQAQAHNIPFEFYFQSAGKMFDTFDRIGNMTIEKISVQVWTSLAYGAKRLSNWTSYGVLLDGNGDKTKLYEPMRKMNKEALAVGQFLYDKKSEYIYHSGVGNLQLVRESYYIDNLKDSKLIEEIPTESVVSVFSDKSGGQYIMIANKDYNFTAEGRLVLKSAKKFSKFNAAANRLEAPTKAVTSIEINIPEGGYALYKVS